MARYRGSATKRRFFRGDAAFALPDLYDFLEAEGYNYAIRLKANAVLQRQIAHLLKRPVGRPPEPCSAALRQLPLSGRIMDPDAAGGRQG